MSNVLNRARERTRTHVLTEGSEHRVVGELMTEVNDRIYGVVKGSPLMVGSPSAEQSDVTTCGFEAVPSK